MRKKLSVGPQDQEAIESLVSGIFVNAKTEGVNVEEVSKSISGKIYNSIKKDLGKIDPNTMNKEQFKSAYMDIFKKISRKLGYKSIPNEAKNDIVNTIEISGVAGPKSLILPLGLNVVIRDTIDKKIDLELDKGLKGYPEEVSNKVNKRNDNIYYNYAAGYLTSKFRLKKPARIYMSNFKKYLNAAIAAAQNK